MKNFQKVVKKCKAMEMDRVCLGKDLDFLLSSYYLRRSNNNYK